MQWLNNGVKERLMNKVIDIEQIEMVGKNRKFGKDHVLTEEYKAFRDEIFWMCKKFHGNPPYKVYMEFRMYHDIDAPVSAVLDGMQQRAFKNDRDVHRLVVDKIPGKKGKPGAVKVWVEELKL